MAFVNFLGEEGIEIRVFNSGLNWVMAQPQMMDLVRRKGEKDGKCLNIMKILGNRSNNFAFFHKTSHLSTSRSNCNAKDKYLGHLLLKLTDVPAVPSTALPCFLTITCKCQKGHASA